MTDNPREEWPAHGGSFTRQPDGSLVRNGAAPAEAKDAADAPPAHKTKTKGK